jgi:hypothetical protein
LLSLIGIGLSRVSAVALNEFLGDSELTESQIWGRLFGRQWEAIDMPNVVKREINELLARRSQVA